MLIATTLASGAAEQPSQPPNPAPPIFRFEADEFWLNLHHFLALVDRHGQAVLRFITGAYGMEWPVGGYPVHFSAFSNWAGAYSTKGNLLVVSSLDAALRGAQGLETVFHEGMRQWDSDPDALAAEFSSRNVEFS